MRAGPFDDTPSKMHTIDGASQYLTSWSAGRSHIPYGDAPAPRRSIKLHPAETAIARVNSLRACLGMLGGGEMTTKYWRSSGPSILVHPRSFEAESWRKHVLATAGPERKSQRSFWREIPYSNGCCGSPAFGGGGGGGSSEITQWPPAGTIVHVAGPDPNWAHQSDLGPLPFSLSAFQFVCTSVPEWHRLEISRIKGQLSWQSFSLLVITRGGSRIFAARDKYPISRAHA